MRASTCARKPPAIAPDMPTPLIQLKALRASRESKASPIAPQKDKETCVAKASEKRYAASATIGSCNHSPAASAPEITAPASTR